MRGRALPNVDRLGVYAEAVQDRDNLVNDPGLIVPNQAEVNCLAGGAMVGRPPDG